jgi:hypothetical protein
LKRSRRAEDTRFELRHHGSFGGLSLASSFWDLR